MTKKAFTLIEIIMVIVVMGILATLAVPRFYMQAEGSKVGEAIQVLHLYYGAQQRYKIDHDTCATLLDCSELDVSVTPKNFNSPKCYTDCGVSILSLSGSYSMYVDGSNGFHCADIIGTPCTYLEKFRPK